MASSKVTAAHQAKLAYVYIRQSSPVQVIRHAESTDLQYQLVERVVSLGWPSDRVQALMRTWARAAPRPSSAPGFSS
ncbi:MAG: hypothetical protein JO108_16725 [Acidobacteriaceae bacterium]|nr:hypothetical protein [Acidobacteriaceae bacterium]